MREMKDSGVPWIGEIPKEIRLNKLKYVVSFEKGKLPTETNLEGRGLPYIGASEMNGFLPKVYTTSAIPLCRKDDILILWDGANAGLVSTNHVGAVSSTVCRVRNRSGMNSRFLFYSIKNAEHYYRDKVSGTTIPHMSTHYLNDTFVLEYSLPEQRRIANFLDAKCTEIDSVLEKTKASIEEYRKLKQSVITEAVTKGVRGKRPMKDSGVEWIGEIPADWRLSRVGLHYQIILGKMLCSEPLDESYSLEKYFCAADVHFSGVSMCGLKTMWFNPIEKTLYKVFNGDLLVVEGGAGAGGAAVASEVTEDIFIQNSIMIVRPMAHNSGTYLKYLLESLVGRGYVDFACNKATIPHFTKDKLGQVPFPLPSTAEQQEIAAYLDSKCAAIDTLISSKEALVAELETYKKSLIYEYVTGKKEVPAV